MDEGASSRPTDTPEGSAGGDDNNPASAASKNPALKDRKCQYCHQAFTSSSLGRHLDQFLFKKKPDGIHDVEEIRRIRSGITRRQARTSSGRRDTPERATSKGQQDTYGSGESGIKSREGAYRMMFNTPTWHATGVINDIPNPSQSQDNSSSQSRIAPSQSRTGPLSYQERGGSNNPDTMRALELALREVLDNIKAATSRMRPRLSPFDFDIQTQTFPSLCLQLLPPPPSLFATSPFPSPSSFPLQPPGVEHLEIVRQALRAKIDQWQSDQRTAESNSSSQSGRPSLGLDSNMIGRNAQQHEDLSLRHLELSFKHWVSMPADARRDAWQLEITRAFAREMEKRKSLDDQLARVQQEANQLRAQVERLGSCQWPREFAIFPPDTLPLPRDVARELDTKESQISPTSSRWDYDNVVAKWKRVVMHDRGMGRVGIGHANNLQDDYRGTENRHSTSDDTTRSRTLNPPPALSPGPSPSNTSGGGASAPPSQQTSPYLQHDHTRSPDAGPQVKRPRLMNGHHTSNAPPHAPDGASSSTPTNQGPPSAPSGSWTTTQPSIIASNSANPAGPTPPPSCSG
ncbi:hypothetical protein ASPCADRAFT_41655 [Aspergillus carbonarius ITEM 5010]|uniref:Uncharacterized protein n=1 Tax=Aspergillus carbonarius (strain ITEM 5010) TaxID=602072 RepID=A0A1R3RX86_ASPC5|nr:hypothetical protein ASPCADRAFT_41655 [Aspergillus carbonarius ITEM 5010]